MSEPRMITSGRQLETAEITAAALLVHRWSQSADDERDLLDALGLPAGGDDGPSDYVPPEQRPQQWAAMARDLHHEGRSTTQIADALCVSTETAERLLHLAGVAS